MDIISKAKRERADDILEAIPRNKGNVTAVCKDLDISRGTFYNYKNEFPEIGHVLEDERENTGEAIEGKLVEMALNGNITACIFYLKTQRGWRETSRVEMDAKVESKVEVSEKVARLNRALAEWAAEDYDEDVDGYAD